MKRANSQPPRQLNKERGTAAVELAIILPLLAILLLGTMEVGSIARDYQVLQNAAREGARISANQAMSAAAKATAIQTIQDRVIAYLANENITVQRANITVDQNYLVTIGTLTVKGSRVTVAYSRPLMLPGVTNFIPALGSLTLTGN